MHTSLAPATLEKKSVIEKEDVRLFEHYEAQLLGLIPKLGSKEEGEASKSKGLILLCELRKIQTTRLTAHAYYFVRLLQGYCKFYEATKQWQELLNAADELITRFKPLKAKEYLLFGYVTKRQALKNLGQETDFNSVRQTMLEEMKSWVLIAVIDQKMVMREKIQETLAKTPEHKLTQAQIEEGTELLFQIDNLFDTKKYKETIELCIRFSERLRPILMYAVLLWQARSELCLGLEAIKAKDTATANSHADRAIDTLNYIERYHKEHDWFISTLEIFYLRSQAYKDKGDKKRQQEECRQGVLFDNRCPLVLTATNASKISQNNILIDILIADERKEHDKTATLDSIKKAEKAGNYRQAILGLAHLIHAENKKIAVSCKRDDLIFQMQCDKLFQRALAKARTDDDPTYDFEIVLFIARNQVLHHARNQTLDRTRTQSTVRLLYYYFEGLTGLLKPKKPEDWQIFYEDFLKAYHFLPRSSPKKSVPFHQHCLKIQTKMKTGKIQEARDLLIDLLKKEDLFEEISEQNHTDFLLILKDIFITLRFSHVIKATAADAALAPPTPVVEVKASAPHSLRKKPETKQEREERNREKNRLNAARKKHELEVKQAAEQLEEATTLATNAEKALARAKAKIDASQAAAEQTVAVKEEEVAKQQAITETVIYRADEAKANLIIAGQRFNEKYKRGAAATETAEAARTKFVEQSAVLEQAIVAEQFAAAQVAEARKKAQAAAEAEARRQEHAKREAHAAAMRVNEEKLLLAAKTLAADAMETAVRNAIPRVKALAADVAEITNKSVAFESKRAEMKQTKEQLAYQADIFTFLRAIAACATNDFLLASPSFKASLPDGLKLLKEKVQHDPKSLQDFLIKEIFNQGNDKIIHAFYDQGVFDVLFPGITEKLTKEEVAIIIKFPPEIEYIYAQFIFNTYVNDLINIGKKHPDFQSRKFEAALEIQLDIIMEKNPLYKTWRFNHRLKITECEDERTVLNVNQFIIHSLETLRLFTPYVFVVQSPSYPLPPRPAAAAITQQPYLSLPPRPAAPPPRERVSGGSSLFYFNSKRERWYPISECFREVSSRAPVLLLDHNQAKDLNSSCRRRITKFTG